MAKEKVSFKAWFKKARLDKGLTQKEIAEMLNVSLVTIVNFEKGKTGPRLCNIKAICDFFRVTPKEIREMLEAE